MEHLAWLVHDRTDIFKIYFYFYFFVFCFIFSHFLNCCSSTVVSIFPSPLPLTPAIPTSHPWSWPHLVSSTFPLYMFLTTLTIRASPLYNHCSSSSPSHRHCSSSSPFHCLDVAVCAFIHLLTVILVAPRFWWLWIKLLYILCAVFCVWK